jgi:hypothetical protein
MCVAAPDPNLVVPMVMRLLAAVRGVGTVLEHHVQGVPGTGADDDQREQAQDEG